VPKSTPDDPSTLPKFPVAGGTPVDIARGRDAMPIPTFNDHGVY
jgi:hypothetical protein